ncbi:uncharacterized protein LOC110914221 [Helianthus annuus]|uniref:uncharacterized protein LOC110914221 n=1 Tax=Helianthus annuus TaxID=4232 RepID=UPI000B8F1A49|nr:uncharacterized protein LOC110914221 [Helianthus annuus]
MKKKKKKKKRILYRKKNEQSKASTKKPIYSKFSTHKSHPLTSFPTLAPPPHLRRATTVPPPSPFALPQLKCTKSNHFFQVTKEAFHFPTISKHFQSCTYCITTCTFLMATFGEGPTLFASSPTSTMRRIGRGRGWAGWCSCRRRSSTVWGRPPYRAA